MKKGIFLTISLFMFLFLIQNCATTKISSPIENDNVAVAETPEEVATEVVRGQTVLKQVDEEAERQEREARARVEARATAVAMEKAEAKAKKEAMAKAKAQAKAREQATIEAMEALSAKATATAVAQAKLDEAAKAEKEMKKQKNGKKIKTILLLLLGLLILIIIIVILLKDRKNKDDDNGPGSRVDFDDDDNTPVSIEDTVFTEDESPDKAEIDFQNEKSEAPTAEEETEASGEVRQDEVNEVMEEQASSLTEVPSEKPEPDPNAVPEMAEAVDEMTESVDGMTKAADEMKEKVLGGEQGKDEVEDKVVEESEQPSEEEVIVVEPEPPVEKNAEIENAVAAMAVKEEVKAEMQGSVAPGTAHIAPNKINASTPGSSLHIYYKPGQDITDYITLIVEVPEGWKKPSREASSSGYFSAEVNEGKVISLSDEGKVMEIELYGLTANSEVKITYGDKSGGGPGLNIPTIKGESVFKIKSGVKGTSELAEIDVNPIVEIT